MDEPTNKWIRLLKGANEYIGVLQLLRLIVTGLLGYLFVTRASQALDNQRFLQGLSGYVSDLKPVMDDKCTAVITGDGRLKAFYRLSNDGKNLVTETSIDVKVVNALTNLPVTTNYSDVGNDHEFGHADMPNGEVLDHTVIFKQQTGVQWKSTKIQFYAKVKTDQTVLQVAKEVLSSRVSETQIDDIGTTTLACVAYPTTEMPIGDAAASQGQ